MKNMWNPIWLFEENVLNFSDFIMHFQATQSAFYIVRCNCIYTHGCRPRRKIALFWDQSYLFLYFWLIMLENRCNIVNFKRFNVFKKNKNNATLIFLFQEYSMLSAPSCGARSPLSPLTQSTLEKHLPGLTPKRFLQQNKRSTVDVGCITGKNKFI